MATLIKGLLSHNLDWQFCSSALPLRDVELCGVGSLAFAVGAYLPLSTTRADFVGGIVPLGWPTTRTVCRRGWRVRRPRRG